MNKVPVDVEQGRTIGAVSIAWRTSLVEHGRSFGLHGFSVLFRRLRALRPGRRWSAKTLR